MNSTPDILPLSGVSTSSTSALRASIIIPLDHYMLPTRGIRDIPLMRTNILPPWVTWNGIPLISTCGPAVSGVGLAVAVDRRPLLELVMEYPDVGLGYGSKRLEPRWRPWPRRRFLSGP